MLLPRQHPAECLCRGALLTLCPVKVAPTHQSVHPVSGDGSSYKLVYAPLPHLVFNESLNCIFNYELIVFTLGEEKEKMISSVFLPKYRELNQGLASAMPNLRPQLETNDISL